jgi:hypothetical protein
MGALALRKDSQVTAHSVKFHWFVRGYGSGINPNVGL